jgi:hypothetical protein
MKKKNTYTPLTEDEARALFEEIMGEDLRDKRPFLTIAFDFQLKYLWESKKRGDLGRFVGADWNAPRYRMTDVMKRYGLGPGLIADLVAHASTYVRLFAPNAPCNPHDLYETELRNLFDYKTFHLARRLQKAVGKRFRVRYQKTADGDLVEV